MRLLITIAILILLASPQLPLAQPVVYSDEALFLADLAALELQLRFESFEDDAAWADARFPYSQPSVTNLGVTWSANEPASNISTSQGPPSDGLWGFFAYPHTWETGDGWTCTTETPIHAAGGWVSSGGPTAKVGLLLDGVLIPDQEWFVTGHRFIGVIDPEGFQSVQWLVIELEVGEALYIFGDAFSFGFPGGTDAPELSTRAMAPRILGNYPNPFNPRTTLLFELPHAGESGLEILDMQGRKVRTLLQGAIPAGARKLEWDGRNGSGQPLPSGVYLARLSTVDGVASQRLVLLK